MHKLMLTLCFTYFLSAEIDLKNAPSFLTLSSPQVAWQETVTIQPAEAHHLNVKSPNQCGKGRMVSISEQKAECEMKSPGLNELQIFVCDDQNTFCRREVLNVQVSYPNDIKTWIAYLKSLFK